VKDKTHTISEESISDLLKRRKQLQAKIDSIKQDFRRGLDKDSSERAVELENAEVLNELLRVSEQQLVDINEKLYHLGENDR